jgi:hypothetical protein
MVVRGAPAASWPAANWVPMATPMRLSAEIEGEHGARLRHARDFGQLGEIHAEQLHRRRQAFLGRRVENDVGARHSTVSQEFCDNSHSSWPAVQPA